MLHTSLSPALPRRRFCESFPVSIYNMPLFVMCVNHKTGSFFDTDYVLIRDLLCFFIPTQFLGSLIVAIVYLFISLIVTVYIIHNMLNVIHERIINM